MNSLPNTTPEAQPNSPKKSGGFMARARGHFGGALVAVAGLFAVENPAHGQIKPTYQLTGKILDSGVIDTNCCGNASTTTVQPPIFVTTLPTAPNTTVTQNFFSTAQVYSDKACATTMVTRASSPIVKPACQPTLSIERGDASLISRTYIPTSAGRIVDTTGAKTGRFTGSASGANDVEQLRRLAGVREENIVRTVLSEENILRAIRAPLPGVAVNQTNYRETVYKPCYGKETMSRTLMEPACEKGPWCGGNCKGKH